MIFPLKNWEKAKRGYRFGEKTFYSPRHLGVDHVVPAGTEIFAPADCEVIFSGCGAQGGNTAWASFRDKEYGTLVIRFMHLKRLSRKGKYKAGEIIGYTGNTGKATTCPHLHTDISRGKVNIRKFSNFIDPEKYFSKRAECA
ncbi:MAG: M23 family metallopeptidase [Patescibacteria group bacterium]|jgi:murein DD-endopeptidase MepM/ murein hydrolase activator NlpD